MQNLPVSSHSAVLTFRRGQAAAVGRALAGGSGSSSSARASRAAKSTASLSPLRLLWLSCWWMRGGAQVWEVSRPPPPRPLPAWSQSVTSNEAYDWWRGVSCSHMACVCPGAKLDTCNCFVLCHLLCLPWQSYWRELLTWRCCHSGLSPAVFLLTSHTMKCCRIWGGGVGSSFYWFTKMMIGMCDFLKMFSYLSYFCWFPSKPGPLPCLGEKSHSSELITNLVTSSKVCLLFHHLVQMLF